MSSYMKIVNWSCGSNEELNKTQYDVWQLLPKVWRTIRNYNRCHIRMSACSPSLVIIIDSNKPRYISSTKRLHKYGLPIMEKKQHIEPEQDMDPYPWIIWYIWKVRNDKLFRWIDRDPLELVRHAESECQAWFDANEVVQPVIQDNNTDEPQAISLGNICLLDGSWTSSAHFSGCGWVWMDSHGNIELMGTRNFTRRESALHLEVEALRWAMKNMLQHLTCQSFGTDCKELIAMIKEPQAWPSFATELKRI